MEEEKKIVKPPFSFTIQLYFLMCWLFYRSIELVEGYPDYIANEDVLTGISFGTQLLSGISDIILYIYAFVGIFKALQHKPESIIILKFSTFYIGLQFLFKLFDLVSSDSRYLLWSLVLLFPVFFFYLYLFKSKKLKEYIPICKRKFGVAGLLGLVIYFLGFWSSGYQLFNNFYTGFKSLPKDISSIQLREGQYTDGLTIFTPIKGWECDTVLKSSDVNTLHIFKNGQNQKLLMTTVPGRCISRIDYYTMLAQCSQSVMGDSISLYEICYKDSTINGNKYYSNTYKVGDRDSVSKLTWTFSALISKDFYKMFTVSGFEKDSHERLEKEFEAVLSSVRFSLE